MRGHGDAAGQHKDETLAVGGDDGAPAVKTAARARKGTPDGRRGEAARPAAVAPTDRRQGRSLAHADGSGGQPQFVPPGKVIDFIDGTLRNETPEEYVRQEIEKSVVREYLYSRTDIRVELRVKLGVASKRVDVAIFPEGSPQRQETIWAICECKADNIPSTHRTEGIEQLKSYMAACVNAEFGMWTNGQERFCFRKVTSPQGIEFVEVIDLPGKGRDLDEVERPNRHTLRPATSDALLFTFRRCHNYIAGNQGLQKPEAFWELLKLIFCKIQDERADEITFYATTRERSNLNGQLRVKERIGRLFTAVKATYGTIFRPNDEIELEPRVLAYLVSQLQTYSLLDSEVDVKGKAYEEIVGSNLRGDRGEFFTPRNVCTMAVQMLDPDPDDLILDPACGTGGFLIVAMNHVTRKIRASEERKWRDPANPTEREQTELFRRLQDYLRSSIVGVDLNPNLVKASKMNMVMNNDGSGGLYQGNSLARAATWSAELRDRELLGGVDVLFTNPPFGSRISIEDPTILEQYELGHVWDYEAQSDSYQLRQPPTLFRSQPPEILFIERCLQFLKPGSGVMAIVLPDAVLGAPGLGYVREWIFRNAKLIASVDMHPDTFQPHNSTQTSLVVLQRKSAEQMALEASTGLRQDHAVFLALADHVGHDKRGNKLYVRDDEGNEIIVTRYDETTELHDGSPVVTRTETRVKVEDDTTAQVAESFRAWLGATSQ